MRRPTNPRMFWATLVLVSGVPRIAGAFFLPNAFGDAYVYIRDIGVMSTKMRAGTFAITDPMLGRPPIVLIELCGQPVMHWIASWRSAQPVIERMTTLLSMSRASR